MIKRIIIICVLTLLITLLYINKQQETISGQVFGTYYQITTSTKNRHIKQINDIFDLINKQMSVFIDDSVINKINLTPANTSISIPKELLFILQKSAQINKETDGFFDITTGKSIELWGFGKNKKHTVPLADKITKNINKHPFILQNNTLIKTNTTTTFNLSAIAKGYAVDKIATLLNNAGYKSFIINIGGEIKTKGDSFKIGIQNPEHKNESIITLPLNNTAIATSGDYENYFIDKNKTYSHIINPKTGVPPQDNLISVSVIHNSAMIADAYATALMAMGDKKALKWANKNKISALFIIKEGTNFKIIKSNDF